MPLKPPPKIHSYKEIPTLAMWETDSPLNTPGPKRDQDPALAVVDGLVSALEKAESHGQRCYRLAELFFATMWWMNHHKTQPGYKPGVDSTRRNAMLSLNLCAANKLALMLWCPIGELARELQDIYGVGMTHHGITTDGPGGAKGGYLDDATREAYRVIFRKGLAYRFNDPKMRLSLLNPDSDAQLKIWHTGEGNDALDNANRYGCLFAMSMSGDLFAGYDGSRGVAYHSSFMGGRPVLCAGTMCFVRGVITRISNDSGHYHPADTSIVKVLQRLRLMGVNLAKMTVVEEVNGGSMRGDAFLAANGNWRTIEKSGTRGRAA